MTQGSTQFTDARQPIQHSKTVDTLLLWLETPPVKAPATATAVAD
jgi:hypothetical protein